MKTMAVMAGVVGAVAVAIAGAVLLVARSWPTNSSPAASGGVASDSPAGLDPDRHPYFDQTFITDSADGTSWRPGTKVADHASVPELFELTQSIGDWQTGDLLIYYVDFSHFTSSQDEGSEQIVVLGSKDDGQTWSAAIPITITGQPTTGRTVDPSLVQLADGRLRLYFFLMGKPGSGNPTQPSREELTHRIYSAVSTDGTNFTLESGVRWSADNITDPDVILFQNQWWMYLSSGPTSQLAVSTDGLAFAAKTLSGATGGVPGALVTDAGVRLFGCADTGLALSEAADGQTFTVKDADIFDRAIDGTICDPSPIRRADGTYLLVYKVRPRAE